MISAKQKTRLLKRKQGENAFLGVVQEFSDGKTVAEKYKAKSDLGPFRLWRGSFPEDIKAIFTKYDGVYT